MEFGSTTNMRFLSSEGMSCEVQCGHIVVDEREKEQKGPRGTTVTIAQSTWIM